MKRCPAGAAESGFSTTMGVSTWVQSQSPAAIRDDSAGAAWGVQATPSALSAYLITTRPGSSAMALSKMVAEYQAFHRPSTPSHRTQGSAMETSRVVAGAGARAGM